MSPGQAADAHGAVGSTLHPMAKTTCGRCGHKTFMKPAGDEVILEEADFIGDDQISQQPYICANCGQLSIRTLLVRLGPNDNETIIKREGWEPKYGAWQAFPDVPEYIAEAAGEATYCQTMEAHRAAGALARAVIEATAKEKGIVGGNLHAKIEAMHAQGLLREHIKDAAHEVRHFGNDMAHGDFVDPVDADEAAEAIALMAEVLNEVFQSPAKVTRARAARLAKKKPQQPD